VVGVCVGYQNQWFEGVSMLRLSFVANGVRNLVVRGWSKEFIKKFWVLKILITFY